MQMNYRLVINGNEDAPISFSLDTDRMWTFPYESLELSEKEKWCTFDFYRCAHCKLEGEYEVCPVAYDLNELIRLCAHLQSYDQAELCIKDDHREIKVNIDVQGALFIIFMHVLLTSVCPEFRAYSGIVSTFTANLTLEDMFFALVSSLLVEDFLFDLPASGNLETRVKSVLSHTVRSLGALLFRIKSADVNCSDANLNGIIKLIQVSEYYALNWNEFLDTLRKRFSATPCME